ncbi:MAG: alpha/beta hydrolase [Clostridia bacterium]|nr:alpha/beta hydrolase [Clostridia bacterium]
MIFEGSLGKMHYEVAGSGERTLLLLHGWGGSTENWIPVVRDFQKDFRVVNVDFPGFGQSPEPETPWSVTEYAKLTLEFIHSLGVDTVYVMAHSFGGRVALMISQMESGVISKQVLTGAAGLPPKKSLTQKAVGGIIHALNSIMDNSLTRKLFGDEKVKALRNKVRSMLGSSDYKKASPMMRETFKLVIHQDLTDCLKSVSASTLLIWGENDTATPLWMGQTMEKEIRDAGLVVFENAGHFAYLERYPRFKAISEKFLIG